MQWHSILSEYGVSVDHEDPDIEMLNKVVEKTMIKKIKSMLSTLNPASSKEMRYAAQVVEQVSYYVDTHEKAYKASTRGKTRDKHLLTLSLLGSCYGYHRDIGKAIYAYC